MDGINGKTNEPSFTCLLAIAIHDNFLLENNAFTGSVPTELFDISSLDGKGIRVGKGKIIKKNLKQSLC